MGEELRKADGGGFSSVDFGVSGGAKGRDGEGHGDAMITAGVDLCTVKSLIAGNDQPVLVFGEFGSHGAEVFGDQGDAVGLLDAEFFCIADGDAVAGVGSDGGEDREFVDNLGGQRSADVHAAEAIGRDVDLNGANEFTVVLFDVENFDLAAEGGDDVEQRGASGVQAHSVEDEIGVGEEKRGAEEEGRGGDIAGDGGIDRLQGLIAGDAELCDIARRGYGAVEGGAEGSECVFGVIAGADGFGEAGGAVSLEAGEEDRSFDLRAGDGGVEVDGAERAAVDGNGGVAFDEFDSRAHLAERLAYAFHRTEGEGVVADECEGVRVGGDQAGEHTHGRAGVAAVERRRGLLKFPGAAGDLDGLVFFVDDGRAERFHACEGGVGIGPGGKVGEAGGAFCNAGQHGVTVRDGFVAGQGNRALKGAGGADRLCG